MKYLVVAVFLMLCLWWGRWRGRRGSTEQPVESPKSKQRRKLRPQTPQDCGQCRVEGEQEAEKRSSTSETRRTWGTSQTRDGLELHSEWWRGYYHFVRPHLSLRVELSQPVTEKGGQRAQHYRRRTPAMAAEITDHHWSVKEFISHPLPEALA